MDKAHARFKGPHDRRNADMEVLPSTLWMDPWRTARFGHDPASISQPLPAVQSAAELPAWMSPAAKQEILDQVSIDPDCGARWWVEMWKLAPQASSPHWKEFQFMAAAMAGVYGWPIVMKDLLDKGAPLEMDRPDNGWQWLTYHHLVKLPRVGLLELCVLSMRASTAVTPFHPKHTQALALLLDAGADPNALSPRTKRELMGQQSMALQLIAAGLDASQKVSAGESLLTHLFSEDRGVAANVHGRILQGFIKAGMPVCFSADGPSVADHLAKTARGLSQIRILFSHPDREGMRAAMERALPAMHKKASRMNEKDRAKFEQAIQEGMLELSTAPALGTSAKRPRL